jgi:hypothetical protein
MRPPKDFFQLFPEGAEVREFDGVTFETLRLWDILAAMCECGHFGVVDRAPLIKRYQNHYLITLERKLRCARCKRLGTAKFWMGRMPR